MMRFRLIFALLGALACLLAALGLEAIFQKINLAANLDDRVSRVLIMRSEIAQRVERAGGRTGDVQITLAWNNRNDLDLWCIDPLGETISYKQERSRSGGRLDVDSNRAGTVLTTHPVENIVWPFGGAPPGHYRIYVYHFGYNGDPDPTPFRVSISNMGHVYELQGTATHSFGKEPGPLFYEFNTTGNASALTRLLIAMLRGALITGIWTALLGFCFTVAVMGGQTLFYQSYYQERFLRPAAAWRLIGWGTLAGLLAGLAGQIVFGLLTTYVSQLPMQNARYIGWILLGGLWGGLIARRMPNLPPRAALLGGLVGGLWGAIAFLASLQEGSGGWGRLAGAALIGAWVGLMIVLITPYEEPMVPVEDLRLRVESLHLRPQRSRPHGTLRSNKK